MAQKMRIVFRTASKLPPAGTVTATLTDEACPSIPNVSRPETALLWRLRNVAAAVTTAAEATVSSPVPRGRLLLTLTVRTKGLTMTTSPVTSVVATSHRPVFLHKTLSFLSVFPMFVPSLSW